MEHSRVTSAAPAALGATRKLGSGKAIGKVVVDSPGRVVAAGERAATTTSANRVDVRDRVVVLVTGKNGSADGSLVVPGARRLAAIPVSGRLAAAREGRDSERAGQGKRKSVRSHVYKC